MAFRPKAQKPVEQQAPPPQAPTAVAPRGRPKNVEAPVEVPVAPMQQPVAPMQQPVAPMQQPTLPAAPPAPAQELEDVQVWAVTDIPTETQAVIYNKETGEHLDVLGALAENLNNTSIILKIMEEFKEDE